MLTENGTAAPATGRVLTVAADGSAAHRTVQSAVDAAAPGDTVLIARGTYRETVNVPAAKKGLTLKGATGNAEDVVLAYDNAASTPKPGGGTYGTEGSATLTVSADGTTVTGLTVQNTFERSAHPGTTATQAVALAARGDRQQYLNSRFIGHQDTVLNWAPAATGQYRQYFRHCFVAGDVDFLFGNATAVYDHVNITLRDRGAAAAAATATSPRPTPTPRSRTGSSSPTARSAAPPRPAPSTSA
ncbi:pectinesterase family protein [Kitasatospora arboriphila]